MGEAYRPAHESLATRPDRAGAGEAYETFIRELRNGRPDYERVQVDATLALGRRRRSWPTGHARVEAPISARFDVERARHPILTRHTERVADLEKPGGRDMAVEAIGATFATVLATGTGSLAPFVAAAATPVAVRMAKKVAREWSRKSRVVAQSTVEASGLGADDLCDALTGDPDMVALTQKVLWAASVSGSDQKLRALGGMLGRVAANPGDRLVETQVVVAALADLEAPHLVVLEVLTGEAPDGWKVQSVPGWLTSHVQARVNLDRDFVLACLSGLTRHGLASSAGGLSGEERFQITKLGRAIALAMHASSSG